MLYYILSVFLNIYNKKKVIEKINESRSNVSEESSKLIVKSFETAYGEAYMQNEGKQPTLYEVCDRFNMDKAICKRGTDVDGKSKIEIIAEIENVVCEVEPVEKATTTKEEFASTSISCFVQDSNSENDKRLISTSPKITV